MTELAINGGDGLKKPHPALLDLRVRQAIGHAIDKQTIVNRVLDGLRQAGRRRSACPRTRAGRRRSRPTRSSTSTSTRRSQMLEDAGYKDTDGDGVREMPGGGEPLNFRYYVRSDGEAGHADRRVRDRLAQGDRHRDHARRSPTTAS